MHQTLCAHNYRLASDFGILESEPAGTSIGPTASTTGTIQLRRIVRRRLPVPTRTQWLVRQSGGLSIAQGPWGMLMVSYCGSVAWLPTADSSPGGIGELFVARGPSISNARFNHTLLHSFIPQVLSLQGDLMLHATCVVIDGRAFLFAGDSTLGKSTLAAGFALQGLDVFSDDIVRIEIAPDGTPLAHRGYPGVRLRGNSFLLPPAQRSRRVGRYGLPKHRIYPQAQTLQASPAPVAGVFFLARGRTVAPVVARLSPMQSMQPFLRASFLQALPKATRSREAFGRAASLAGAIPALRLSYRRSARHFDALLASLTAMMQAPVMVPGSAGT
jgi:hypothetical protein